MKEIKKIDWIKVFVLIIGMYFTFMYQWQLAVTFMFVMMWVGYRNMLEVLS